MCHKTFCLEHRTYESHACVNARGQGKTCLTARFCILFARVCVLFILDHRTVKCPLCGKSIHFVYGEDIHAQFERHTLKDCSPAPRETKASRCAVQGCKEKLTIMNRVECPKCRKLTCLTHRYSDLHECGRRGFSLPQSFLSVPSSAAAAPPIPPAAPPVGARLHPKPSVLPQQQRPTDPNNTVRGSAARRMRPESSATAEFAPAVIAPPHLEVCPQCSSTFSSPGDLIAHVESAHSAFVSQERPTPSRSPGASLLVIGNGGPECCPQCGAGFAEVTDLVLHTEAHCPRRARPSQPPLAAPPTAGDNSLCAIS